MNLNQTNSVEPTPSPVDQAPLSYAQFSQLLAQYKRAVYESMYQAKDPVAMLVRLPQQ